MQLSVKQVFYGANLYANVPVVVIAINKEEVAIEYITQCCKTMQSLFGEYIDQDIDETTPQSYIGNTISNFALNLINHNKGTLTTSGTKVEDEIMIAWIEFDILQVTIKTIELVFKILITLLQNKPLEKDAVEKLLANYAKFAQQYNSYDTNLLKASKELDIPSFQYSSGASLYRQYGWGKNSRVFRSSSPMEDSYHGVFTSMDKAASKEWLKNIGLPVAKDVVIHSKEQLPQAVEKVGYPCVVKPIRGTEAIGISVDIGNFDELQKAFDNAKASSFGNNPIMIEEFVEGDAHRLLVVRGKLMSSAQKKPAILIGDGQSTIQQLIEQINHQRANPDTNPDNLKPIKLRDLLINHLAKFNLTLDSILANAEQFKLSSMSTYSYDGAAIINRKETTHQDIVNMAEILAQVTQIDVLAIDYITTDISKSFHEVSGGICEYNHYPGLGSLEAWSNETLTPLEVARTIIGYDVARVPIHLIIADSHLVAQIQNWLKSNIADSSIGWLCNHEAYLGELQLTIYNQEGWEPVKLLLRQKTLAKAVVVTTQEEIMQKGMPLDKFDIIYCNRLDDEWYSVLEKATQKLKEFKQTEQLQKFMERECLI
ncbi:MAG: ATP-grasp domain-containing protein [Campylobacterales bacterium]|nr:ATP-grasp domain-containing protein [Campylobacterales bacterium]